MGKRYIELLAPAGDLEKLKVALLYGADACFIGGKKFSLRSRASNFTLEDIKEGCEFAHKLGKKIHVTCNIVMHNNDLDGLEKYLKDLEACGVDAIITSSLYMAKLVRRITKMEAHISTQESSLNEEAVEYFYKQGATRVVLGRECSLDDIEKICKNKPCEIEAFIHGGMCSSYSGRCMLSNIMTRRDANRGGCAHSCRWKYKLYNDEELITKGEEYFSMSSKDLCSLKEVRKMIDIGVDSLKIEGRMKSLNYVACIVKAYREVISDYLNDLPYNEEKYNFYLDACENRDTSYGFLHGEVKEEGQLFNLDLMLKKAGEFIGIVKKYDKDNHICYLELKNKITAGEKYIVLSSTNLPKEILIDRFYVQGEEKDVYSVASSIITFKCEEHLLPYDIIRLKK